MSWWKCAILCAATALISAPLAAEEPVSPTEQPCGSPFDGAEPPYGNYDGATDSCSQASDDCDGGCGFDAGGLWRPRLYARAEALVLERDNSSEDRAIVIDDITLESIVTTQDLNTGYEVGPRLLLGYQVNECSAFEVEYFGIHTWDDSLSVVGNGDLSLPGDIALATFDFLAADEMVLDYASEIHNFELNFVKSYGELRSMGEFSWLAGFRYVSFEDEFNIQSTNVLFGTSDYNIKALNDLWGAQLGGRGRRVHGCWGWDATGKVGLFGNAAEQNTFLGDFDNQFIFRDLRSSDTTASLVADANLSLTYFLNRVWSARIGYNVLWLQGVALAPDQLDFTDTPTSGGGIDNEGAVFLHGANVGLEARW